VRLLRGLGLVAGAVLQVVFAVGLAAQVPTPTPQPPRPAPTDTVRPRPAPRDTVRLPAPADTGRGARIDSVRGIPDTLKTRVRADSIQAPLARAEVPTAIGVGPLYRWTRDSILSTGAANLTDLLERVPGVTVYRSGFLASAQTAAYLGDMARIRVFRDGVELDVLDPRAGGVRDLADVQLANVDELSVERAAGELRVHVRTWSVRNTTPYTRVDAFTGDEETNLYRFFYGRRFGSGFAAQAGVQQFGTGARNRRTGGGGNVLDALARVGWARGAWSVDATYAVLNRQRDLTTTFIGQDSVLRPFEGRRSEGSFRVAYGDPESGGPWAQAIASSARLGVSETSSQFAADSLGRRASGVLAIDTVFVPDSAASRRQYVLTGGYTLGPVRLSVTDRVRSIDGAMLNTPSARATFDTPWLSASAFVERNAPGGYVVAPVTVVDSVYRLVPATPTAPSRITFDEVERLAGRTVDPLRTSRADVSARLTPLPWVALLGSVSRESRRFAADSGDRTFDGTSARLEAAVRLGRLWLSGGLLRRGTDSLVPPSVYDCIRLGEQCTQLQGEVDSAQTGATFGVRGKVVKDVYLDVVGTGWNRAGAAYRPQYQLRGEVGVQTNWLSRFPSGNFGFKFAVIDEYRSRVRFPIAVDPGTAPEPGPCPGFVCAAPANVVTAQLEIRIQTGVVSYQLRNALNRQYELVPGLRMPGPVSYYGVRWTFWN
jgi:hypothetical protein